MPSHHFPPTFAETYLDYIHSEMSTSPLVNQYFSIPTLQLGGLALEPRLQNRGTILGRDDSAHIGGKPDEVILSLVRRVSYLVSSSKISLCLAVGT
jgi:hypothetical protein